MLEKDENNFIAKENASELVKKISDSLDRESVHKLSLTCYHYFNLFAKERVLINQLVAKLFEYTVKGQQENVKELLEKHPKLLTWRVNGVDNRGRNFQNVTAFEYILWALDVRYMAPMMLQSLPRNEEGEETRKILVAQLNKFEAEGIHYILNGIKYNEKFFTLAPLIEVLKKYCDLSNSSSLQEQLIFWCGKVREQQLSLPAHFVHHYCDLQIPFRPIPAFTAETLIRSSTIMNCLDGKIQDWFDSTSPVEPLELSFAVYRDNFFPQLCVTAPVESVQADIEALLALEKRRLMDFCLFKVELEKSFTDDASNQLLVM